MYTTSQDIHTFITRASSICLLLPCSDWVQQKGRREAFTLTRIWLAGEEAAQRLGAIHLHAFLCLEVSWACQPHTQTSSSFFHITRSSRHEPLLPPSTVHCELIWRSSLQCPPQGDASFVVTLNRTQIVIRFGLNIIN